MGEESKTMEPIYMYRTNSHNITIIKIKVLKKTNCFYTYEYVSWNDEIGVRREAKDEHWHKSYEEANSFLLQRSLDRKSYLQKELLKEDQNIYKIRSQQGEPK
jgi:hypothetical protein